MASGEEYTERRRELLQSFDAHIEQCRPDPTTPELTKVLKERYHYIQSYAQWREVEEGFASAVLEYGVISFDTESQRLVKDAWAGLDSYLIGTYSGDIYDLSIPDLKRESAKEGRLEQGNLASVLPITVVRVLEDRKVLKLGSDAGRDALQDEELGLHIGPVFCVQILHGLVNDISPSQDLVSGAPGQCNGLGRQAFDIFGMTHKEKVGKFFQPAAWKPHAHYKIYDWRKPLSGYAFLYRALDACLPMVLLSWILKNYLESHQIAKALVCGPLKTLLKTVAKPAKAKGSWFFSKAKAGSVSRPIAQTYRKGTGRLPDVLESDDPEENRQTREAEVEEVESKKKESGASECAVVSEQLLRSDDGLDEENSRQVVLIDEESEEEMMTDAIGQVEVPNEEDATTVITVESECHPNGEGLTSQDLQMIREELNQTEAVEEVSAPANSLRRRRGKRLHLRRSWDSKFKRANVEKRKDNKFRFRPLLHKWCSYCGRTTHSKRDKNRRPICQAFRRQLSQLVQQKPADEECMYGWCKSRTGHRTGVCPVMSSRCRTCYLRGHEEDECHQDPFSLERYKKEFELHADQHPLLSQRREEPAWGFFYIKNGQNVSYTYSQLLEMPVQEAIKRLKEEC